MKTIINKQNIKAVSIALLVGLIIGWLAFRSPQIQSTDPHAEHEHKESLTYTCSMHPQIKQDKPGLCPICAMDLVPMDSGTNEDLADPNEIQMTPAALALVSVQTSQVTKGLPQKELYLFGKVEADERNIAELTARYGGRIEKLYVNYTGQEVMKGEVLGTIYSPELINAQQELLEAVKQKSSNPALYRAARSKLALWEVSEQQIDAIIKQGEPSHSFEILSPISGTVSKRQVAQGDYVKEGASLFEIIDLSKVWVLFEAYESDLPWIQEGDLVEFTVQSIPGENFSGKVKFLSPFVDSKSRVAHARVETNNPSQKLKPGMFANGILRSGKAGSTEALLIPKSAVLWTGKRSVAYVKTSGENGMSFKLRNIVLGPEAGRQYIVVKGLEEGEIVASNGVFKIDAAAQLAGKTSMMNPNGETKHIGHEHGGASNTHPHNRHDQAIDKLIHKSFHVSGNCGMCEETIEAAANALDGVETSDWNRESKQIHVSFNPNIVELSEIHQAIARAGYDTDKEKADNEVYENLPGCCQYTREDDNN